MTPQQRERIRRAQERRKAAFQDARAGDEDRGDGGEAGLVITHHGTTLLVEATHDVVFRCSARQHLGNLVSGDRVIWRPAGDHEGVVVAVQERRSVLTRPDYGGRPKPVAANLDQVVVVIAPRPEPTEYLIDRYLVAIALMPATALLVVNKADLLDAGGQRAMQERLAPYHRIGCPVLFTSRRLAQGLADLRACLRDRVSILVGQSGVGKSSLIKALLPDRAIRVQALSAASGLGTHATTASTLYHLPEGGDLIDSPGVRGFDLGPIGLRELERGFVEFAPYLGHCRFTDCTHRVEPGCALLAAVARGEIDPRRLASYQHIKSTLSPTDY